MGVTKPIKFRGFGAQGVAKPHMFAVFGCMGVTTPDNLSGFGVVWVSLRTPNISVKIPLSLEQAGAWIFNGSTLQSQGAWIQMNGAKADDQSGPGRGLSW
jgi:hypothetical protein